ncbi:hypothetical protein [Mucilaginibacter sp. SG564]|uniref:hypothetical protein n=1 Tax=unclassified Mucilaginibacter TaxID=2617802 RepID=UPI001551BE18|nr:hypothetical protein [Mucilaginibacter sp. SG564]NOW97433.1 hypothetical protein [Mucilaginibacter sp. SG564]
MSNLRLLSEEQSNRIRLFYKTGFPIGIIFILAFGIPISIVAAAFAGIIAAMAVLLLIAVGIYLIVKKRNQKIAHALEVYQYGTEEDIYFDSIELNYSYEVNGRPQQIINIRRRDELIQVKTFSNRVCDAFRLPSQKAYFYDRYPEIVLPSSIFYTAFDNKQDPPQKTRSVSI